MAKDPAQTAILDKYTAISAPDRQPPDRRLDGAARRATRTRPASRSLGDIIADSQLAATAPSGFGDAVVAFMNPGGIRTDIDAGDITYGEAFAVQPFGNSLVTMTLTGAQIDRVLEQQWDGQGTSPKVLQVSNGLTYTWSAAGPLGSRVDRRLDQDQRRDRRSGGDLPGHGQLVPGRRRRRLHRAAQRHQPPRRRRSTSTRSRRTSSLPANDPIAPTPRDRITVVP